VSTTPTPTTQQRWEYRVLSLKKKKDHWIVWMRNAPETVGLEVILNHEAREGWEFVSMVVEEASMHTAAPWLLSLIFKRPSRTDHTPLGRREPVERLGVSLPEIG